jgi:hypothetical protein
MSLGVLVVGCLTKGGYASMDEVLRAGLELRSTDDRGADAMTRMGWCGALLIVLFAPMVVGRGWYVSDGAWMEHRFVAFERRVPVPVRVMVKPQGALGWDEIAPGLITRDGFALPMRRQRECELYHYELWVR